MKMTIRELDELVKLLEKFEKDELIQKLDTDGKIKVAIDLIKDIAIDIII